MHVTRIEDPVCGFELTLCKASIDSKFDSETHGGSQVPSGTKRLNPKETVIKALELDPNHSSSFLEAKNKKHH